MSELQSSTSTSFGAWVKRKFADRAHPGMVNYLAGTAADKMADCERYAELLSELPIELSVLGMGENGHIGFNDPRIANFADSTKLRVVTLGDRCRLSRLGKATERIKRTCR